MLHFLATLAVLYALVCVLAFVFERKLVYFPGDPPRVTPADAGLAFEEHHLCTEDGVELHAWWIPIQDAWGTVLVCHGNAGNVGDRLHFAQALSSIGLSVLLFDYRGYGKSTGSPNEKGLYTDAETAWNWLVERQGIAPERLAVLGESLGGGVAVELATRREIGALIIQSSFTSIPDVGARAYPFLPVRLLSREKFDSLSKLDAISCPLLLLHAPDDELVPFEHAVALQKKAPAGTRLVETEGGHNGGGFPTNAGALEAVREFLLESLSADAPPESAH